MYHDTKILDSNGKKIFTGMLLKDIECRYLTYQVRIRNNKYVLHTGSSYSLLTTRRAKSLMVLDNASIDILGYGHKLFNSNL
jgi:acetyl-CoA carboxylase beta subunit